MALALEPVDDYTLCNKGVGRGNVALVLCFPCNLTSRTGALVIVLTLDEINALDQDHFVAMLGGLFEGPPWIITTAWSQRPFGSVHALYEVLCRIMSAAPLERRIALIQSHPD